MSDSFRLTLAQLNPTVGDFTGNAAKARDAWQQGKDAGAQLVALPEMFITGYQVQDLVLKPAFTQGAADAVAQLARDCADGPALGVGHPIEIDGALYNAYSILEGGEVKAQSLKHELPNTDVFDERRLYTKGPLSGCLLYTSPSPRDRG